MPLSPSTKRHQGFALLQLLNAVSLHDELSRLFDLAQSGALKVFIGGRYPLEQSPKHTERWRIA
jgi:NADPH:quinone reductase-like Zn-dependent oxidoreductase